MEKICCDVKVVETDEGVRIEAKGEGIKKCFEAWKKGELSCCGFGRRS
ncbi:MAG: hypothetical protein HY930_03470 [Euryarchaeota archaeon]|nr:hypothetical protein [Euryarchaeota archaeon]